MYCKTSYPRQLHRGLLSVKSNCLQELGLLYQGQEIVSTGILALFWNGVNLILLILGATHVSGNEKFNTNQKAAIHGPLMIHELLPKASKKSKFSSLRSLIVQKFLFSPVLQKCPQNFQHFTKKNP